jgi:hypothetical protein
MQNPLCCPSVSQRVCRPRELSLFQRAGLNQDGVEVMSFERTMLIYKRGHSPEAAGKLLIS